MKKIFVIFPILICLVMLTSCRSDSPSVVAREQARVIIDCLKTGETEDLKGLFCDKVADSHDIDKEVENAMNFIDGNIISDGEWHGMTTGGTSWDDGKKTKLDINPCMENIETDTGKKYMVTFCTYLIYDKHSENLGITYITIKEMNNGEKYKMIGEIID